MIIKTPNYPPPNHPMMLRELSQISDLIIHHSDGPPDQSPLAIDQEHRNQGWSMIGYNFIIQDDGTVSAARPLQFVPSAAYGRNTQSVNVCLTGDFQPGTAGYQNAVPALQFQMLKDLCVYLHQRLPTIVRTIGHRDVASIFYPDDTGPYSTACPGQMLYNLIPSIKSYVKAKVHSL